MQGAGVAAPRGGRASVLGTLAGVAAMADILAAEAGTLNAVQIVGALELLSTTLTFLIWGGRAAENELITRLHTL